MALEANVGGATLRLVHVLFLFLDFGAYRFLKECPNPLGTGSVLTLGLRVFIGFGQGLRSRR